jgi:hypothetical protein
LAIARIAVPSLVKRRNAAVTIVITSPSASAITFVYVTEICPTWNVLLSVGIVRARDAPPLDGHSRSITPSRISSNPSVAVALTSGSRPDSAGPKIIP